MTTLREPPGSDNQTSSAAAISAADWLSLAAAPTFAIMGLMAETHANGGFRMLCSAARDASPLSEMALMYGLMSAFHSAAWFRLICGNRSNATQC